MHYGLGGQHPGLGGGLGEGASIADRLAETVVFTPLRFPLTSE